MKKSVVLKCLFIFIISIASAISFTRVTNDFHHMKLMDNISKDTKTLIFIPAMSNRGDENITQDKKVIIRAIDKYDVFIYQSLPLNGLPTVRYANMPDEYNSIVDEYNRNCKINCIVVEEQDFNDLNFSQGFTFKTDNYLEFKNELRKSGYNFVIPGEDERYGNEVTSLQQAAYEALLNNYKLYINIFITMVVLICFFVILHTIKRFKEFRLQSIFGFKYTSFLKVIIKENLLKLLLPYMFVTLIVSYIYYPSFNNLFYNFVIILCIIMIVNAFILIITFIIYRNISKKVLYSFSNFIIIVVSAILIILSVSLIYSISSVASSQNFFKVSSDNNQYADDYYSIPYDLNLTDDEHTIVSKNLIDSGSALYVTYNTNPNEPSMPGILEVDYKFFERNPQITFEDGSEVNYEALKELNKPTEENVESSKGILPPGLTDEEIVEIITPELAFFVRGIDINWSLATFKDTRRYSVIDDGRDYHTFHIFGGDVKLKDVGILINDKNFLTSDIYIETDSFTEAQSILEEAYEKSGIECEISVTSLDINARYSESLANIRDSIISVVVGIISLIITVIVYLELILNKHSNKVMLASIYGFKKFKVQRPINLELLVTNLIILVIILVTMLTKIAIITYLILVLIEIIIAQFRINNFIKSNIVTYLKGELNND